MAYTRHIERTLLVKYHVGRLLVTTSRSAYFNTTVSRALQWASHGEGFHVTVHELNGKPVAKINRSGITMTRAASRAPLKSGGPNKDRWLGRN